MWHRNRKTSEAASSQPTETDVGATNTSAAQSGPSGQSTPSTREPIATWIKAIWMALGCPLDLDEPNGHEAKAGCSKSDQKCGGAEEGARNLGVGSQAP